MPRARYFEPGGTLSPKSASYVKRQADDVLLRALRVHEYCYVLDSRQKGKSSLMVRVAGELREEGFQSVVLDLQGRGSNVTLEQWYLGMLTPFAASSQQRAELMQFWKSNTNLGPLDRFFRGIEEIILPTVEVGLVVFVDEVDFVRSLPFKTDEFFAGIRHFYNVRATDPRFEKISFVLIGTADPIELIADPKLTPFNVGRRIELQDFRLDECETLRKGLHENPEIASKLIDRVIYWTSGHPYLTQKLCELIVEADGISKPSDVDRIVNENFLSADSQTSEPNLYDVRRRASDTVPAEVEPNVFYERRKEIYGQLLKGKVVYDAPQDPVVTALKLAGLVSVVDGKLRIRTEIYRRVFDQKWLDSLPMPEAVDAVSNKISWLHKQSTKRALFLVGAACLLIFAVYSFEWSFGQPAFNTSVASVAPGAIVGLNGSHLPGATARLIDDRGVESTMEVTPQSSDNAFPFAIQVAKSFPPGRYQLSVRRAPFLGFLALPWSSHAANITVVDNRPFDLAGHTGMVATAVFSPDGKSVLTASSDRTARIWNLEKPADIREFKGHQNTVISAYYSSDGKKIATASWDSTAVVWDVATGKKICTLSGHTGNVWRASFSPDGTKVLTAGEDKTARVWDATTGKELMKLTGHTGRVMCDCFSPDGSKIATASFDGTIRIWDAHTGKQLLQIPTPNGRTLVDPVSHKTIMTLPSGGYKAFFVSFSPDGSKIVTALDVNLAVVWDVATGKPLVTLKGHTDWVVFAAFSPDGNRIVTSSVDKTARVWDAKTGKQMLVLAGHKVRVNTAYFSPDGKEIVTAALEEKIARLWDATTGKPLPRPVSY